MRPIRCAALLAIAIAGCEGEVQRPAEDPPPAQPIAETPAESTRASGTIAITEAATLVGEYRVAGVDGRDIDLPHGIVASIGPSRIDVDSQCVAMAWSYRLEGERLVTEAIPVISCDRGRYPEEAAIEAAFDAAHQVRRTPANALEFSGDGHSVLLFSQ